MTLAVVKGDRMVAQLAGYFDVLCVPKNLNPEDGRDEP
jgi:hypothetical protein